MKAKSPTPVHRSRAQDVQAALQTLGARVHNARSFLPGERPTWVVVELSGAPSLRVERPKFLGIPIPTKKLGPSLEDLTRALDTLGDTSWIRGVVLRIEGLRADGVVAYSLREAIARLTRKGKKTQAYLSQLSLGSLYLASAAAEVVVPESAEIDLRGLGISMQFYGDALARHGIRFEKVAIAEYKNAFDTLSRGEMTPAQREQLTALLDRLGDHYLGEIAAARRLPVETVKALFDEGITSAARARDAGLVDRLAYEDELLEKTHRLYPEAKRFLKVKVPKASKKRVAVVMLQGGIISGKSKRSPVPLGPLGNRVAGSETVVCALREAASDPATAAVVLYVDSGGGSALASDLIGREVKRIQSRIPVVAVMGNVAASGGYYVLTHASKVIAAPSTITGSIGVLTGKLVVEGLFEKLGVKTERIEKGRHALLFDTARGLSDEDKALLAKQNQEIYGRFVARVSEGRGLPLERVHEIAKGRVWSGAAAVEIGLVDELGDLDLGIMRARELAGLAPDAPVVYVDGPDDYVLPAAPDAAVRLTGLRELGDTTALFEALRPLLSERSWLVGPGPMRLDG